MLTHKCEHTHIIHYLKHFSISWSSCQMCNSVSLRVFNSEENLLIFLKAALWVSDVTWKTAWTKLTCWGIDKITNPPSLFKPLNCLQLKCLSRTACSNINRHAHLLLHKSAQLLRPSLLKLISLYLVSGALCASCSMLVLGPHSPNSKLGCHLLCDSNSMHPTTMPQRSQKM